MKMLQVACCVTFKTLYSQKSGCTHACDIN